MSGNLLDELKRRKVFKVGAAYLVVAWLAVQAASISFPAFDAPPWALRVFILIALLGFPLAVVMAWIFESTSEGMQLDTARTGGKRIIAVAVGLAALALAWFFYGQATVRPDERVVANDATATASTRDSAIAEGPSPPNAAPANPKSIAVLAFTDLSPAKDQEYFSDGMAEEILNALAQVEGLKVAGRTSAFHYKGRNVDLREIGRQLGVANVLEGSVRKQGDEVRITAQLIRTDDGTHRWSKSFDGKLTDVFQLQEDVARAITDELEIVLQQGQRLVPIATQSPEAHALYLKATSTFDRRDGPNMAEAAQQLEQATRIDPGYARAWSRLAAVYAVLPTYTGTENRGPDSNVNEAARRAIALDAHLAEPWAVLGLIRSQGKKDLLAARANFDKALRIDPDDVTTNFWYGLELLRSGYVKDGTARIDHALAVDPMVPNVMRWRGVAYLRQGDIDGAEQFLKRAHSAGLKISGRELAEIAASRGQFDEAKRLWREGTGPFLTSLPPGGEQIVAAGLYGNDPAARGRAIALLEKYVGGRDVVSGLVPLVLAQMGRDEEAVETMRLRVPGDDADFMAYLFSPAGASLRKTPEYRVLIRDAGFPALWAKYGPPDFERK